MSNLIGMIALDLGICTDNETNWYGLVEYVIIDGCVTTSILDFNERVMDWKTRRLKEKNIHLSQTNK